MELVLRPKIVKYDINIMKCSSGADKIKCGHLSPVVLFNHSEDRWLQTTFTLPPPTTNTCCCMGWSERSKCAISVILKAQVIFVSSVFSCSWFMKNAPGSKLCQYAWEADECMLLTLISASSAETWVLLLLCSVISSWSEPLLWPQRPQVSVSMCLWVLCVHVCPQFGVWSYDGAFCSVDMLWLLNLG